MENIREFYHRNANRNFADRHGNRDFATGKYICVWEYFSTFRSWIVIHWVRFLILGFKVISVSDFQTWFFGFLGILICLWFLVRTLILWFPKKNHRRWIEEVWRWFVLVWGGEQRRRVSSSFPFVEGISRIGNGSWLVSL